MGSGGGEITKILLVEDDGLIAMQIQLELEGWGYTVLGAAPSSEDAVSMARELSPDLILMDIVMQGKYDGIEAVEKIKRHQDIPVIYTTGYHDDETIERARKTNPEAYLLKPYRSFEIRAAIEITIQRRQFQRKSQKKEEKYRNLFEKAINGIIIGHPRKDIYQEVQDFIVVDANPAFLRMMQREKEQLVGKNFSELFPGLEGNELFSNLKEVITSKNPQRFEYYSANYKKHYEVLAFATGENELAANFRNITLQKKYEKAQYFSAEI
ncbi:MAG: hypothetical protein BME94_00340 [Methanobacteriales archaeon Met13]